MLLYYRYDLMESIEDDLIVMGSLFPQTHQVRGPPRMFHSRRDWEKEKDCLKKSFSFSSLHSLFFSLFLTLFLSISFLSLFLLSSFLRFSRFLHLPLNLFFSLLFLSYCLYLLSLPILDYRSLSECLIFLFCSLVFSLSTPSFLSVYP